MAGRIILIEMDIFKSFAEYIQTIYRDEICSY
jgi:hypothetical protein